MAGICLTLCKLFCALFLTVPAQTRRLHPFHQHMTEQKPCSTMAARLFYVLLTLCSLAFFLC